MRGRGGFVGVEGTVDGAPSVAVGVNGRVSAPTGVGVKAENTAGGPGLQVVGQASFSTIGSAEIPRGSAAVAIAAPAITANSHVTVTLVGDPGPPVVVQWIERQPGVGFVVHLTGKVTGTTPFTYFSAEP